MIRIALHSSARSVFCLATGLRLSCIYALRMSADTASYRFLSRFVLFSARCFGRTGVLFFFIVGAAAAFSCFALLIFPDGNLNSLKGKSLAELRAFAHAWEFLGGVNLKFLTECISQDRCPAPI